jgi:dipeptidase E
MYLSSYRLGDHPERMVAMLKAPARAAVIANACDAYPSETRPGLETRRQAGVSFEIAALGGLGIEAEELDLRAYFGRKERLAAELARYQLVWVRGGNTFVLRHAMAESGADALLIDLLRRDALVYAGYSAGVCVLTPGFRGLEVVDEPAAVSRIYGTEARWDGLGVLDHYFVPHYRTPGHPETEMCERLANHYRTAGLPHVTLRDGQAIVIDGGTTTIV